MNHCRCLIAMICLFLLRKCVDNMNSHGTMNLLEVTLMYSNIFIRVISMLWIIYTLKLPICDILSKVYYALGMLCLATLNSTVTLIIHLGRMVLKILAMWSVKYKKFNIGMIKVILIFNLSLMHLCHCLEEIFGKYSQINGLKVTCTENDILINKENYLNKEDVELINGCGTVHLDDVASKLPDNFVKEKSRIVTFSEVSLVQGVMSEVHMFSVMDETEKENKFMEVTDDEKPDIHEEISVNSSSLSSEANEMNESLPLLESLSLNDSVELLSLIDPVELLSLNDSVELLSPSDPVELLSLNDSVELLSPSDPVELLSLNDSVVSLSINDFEENQDCGLTANGSILQLCTETSIFRVLEVDSYNSQIGHCTGQYDDNSIGDKVWSNPDYQIIPVTKSDEVYSSDKLSQVFDSNKSEKSNISTISSGCCSTNSNQQGVQICRCEFTVSANKYSTELSKHPKSSPFSDDFLPTHRHFDESIFSSKGLVDLQTKQAKKSVNTKYSDGEEYLKKCRKHHDIARIVKTTLIELERKRVTKKSSALKCNRMNKKRRISRRRLRRIIFSNQIKSPRSFQIQVRPVQNSPQTSTTSNELNTSHLNQNGTTLSLQQQNSVQNELQVHNISTFDLVSESPFATPAQASSSSLTSYFNRLSMGYEYSLEEMMQYEWLRVQTFQDFPATCHASPLHLARTGFFSNGINDEVICFSCGVKYKNWKKKDNPIEVHHGISLDCRMVNGREINNIPIISKINALAADNVQRESSQSLLTDDDFLPSTIHQNEDVSIQTTEGALNRSLIREDIQSSNVADTTSQSVNQTLQPCVVHHAMRQPAVDRDHSVLDGEQNTTEDKSNAEDLGISLEKPKYQAYAQLNDRVSTFQGWPGHLDQAPRDMALAGFFYEGCNDYCRCFFCGGGLRNWEAGDDPWVEHARWFSNCAFVRQNRGHRFVEKIVKSQLQAEMQASNNSSDIAKNQTAVANQSEMGDRTQINSQETSATTMFTQSATASSYRDPAVESIREFGYSDEIIQRAIDLVNSSNPETNTAVVSENIASSALLSLPQPSQQPVSQPSLRTASRQPSTQTMPASTAETSCSMFTVTTFETAFDTASGRISGQASATNENESSSLQEENIQYKEQGICKTCNTKNVPVAFLPCGHLDCCIDCASAMLKCPMCMVDIKQSLKRQVPVSSQRNLQEMEEIQNYICSSEDLNVQNTQPSVLNNSEPSFEIQQSFKESEFHPGNAIPIIEPVHGQLSDDGPSVPRMCDYNGPIIRALSQNQNNFEVSSQRNVQEMEEIQNYICSSEDPNVQNTQPSVLNNSEPSFEIQQSFKESEFHPGNAIPIIEPVHGQLSDDGPSVPRMCDNNGPIIRALSQNQNNFEGLPLMLQVSSVSSLFDNTCTIDTPLTIIFCQMFSNQNLHQLFANSIYDIFRFELPNLLSLLMRGEFDDVRRVWSEIIGHRRRRNFYGSDAYFVMDPFSSLLLYHYRFNCTNFKCPTNERTFDMPGLTLPQIPIGEVFDVTTFQQLINNFASQLECPCNEHLVQTVSESREENARYTYVLCSGQLTITRAVIDIPEQPPMIIINMEQSGLRGRNIRNLNGTVQIGACRYYIGGLTFAANNHFTGRILLPHQDRTLLYCNGQGMQVLGDNEEHPDYQDSLLSLVFLFRIM